MLTHSHRSASNKLFCWQDEDPEYLAALEASLADQGVPSSSGGGDPGDTLSGDGDPHPSPASS